MRNQPNHYLDWLESHARKELTLAEWFDVITTFYSIDFQGSNTGRPSKLKKRVAIQFFLEYGKSDYMKYALEKVGVYRSTAWPWKHRYWTVDAMYRLAPTLNYKQRAEFPFYWKRIRKQRIRLLQQKGEGVLHQVGTLLEDGQHISHLLLPGLNLPWKQLLRNLV